MVVFVWLVLNFWQILNLKFGEKLLVRKKLQSVKRLKHTNRESRLGNCKIVFDYFLDQSKSFLVLPWIMSIDCRVKILLLKNTINSKLKPSLKTYPGCCCRRSSRGGCRWISARINSCSCWSGSLWCKIYTVLFLGRVFWKWSFQKQMIIRHQVVIF